MRYSLLILGIFFVGCSTTPPPPVHIDEGGMIHTINQGLIDTRDFSVPKDPFLRNNNWDYQILTHKSGDEYFINDEIPKVFYLAQNADEIIIIGKPELISEYKNYFINNQVTAKIQLRPLNYRYDKDLINILFFHTK